MTVNIRPLHGQPHPLVQITTRNAFKTNKYTFLKVSDREKTLVPVKDGRGPTRTVRDALGDEGYTLLNRDEVTYVSGGGLHVPHVRCAYADDPGVVKVEVLTNPELFDGCFAETVEATGHEQYAFHRVDAPHIDGDAVVYVGHSTSVDYPSEKSLDDVPEAVVEAVEEGGLCVVVGVDSGWETWEGRPEWSETYVDAGDADPATRD